MEVTESERRKNYFVKAKPNVVRCPKCNSDHIKSYSRVNYIKKAGMCLLFILPVLMVPALVDMGGPAALVVFIIVIATVVISVVRLVYYLVMLVITKHTTDKCMYCKNIL